MSTIIIDAPEAHSLDPQRQIRTEHFSHTALKMIVWTLTTIIFGLVLFDFYVQTQAKETKIALQCAQTEKLEVNKDLRVSEIDQYIAGSPVVQTRPADQHTNICKEMKQYTWKGFFKNYSISVYVGIGKDPSVDFVHSPGETIISSEEQTSTL